MVGGDFSQAFQVFHSLLTCAVSVDGLRFYSSIQNTSSTLFLKSFAILRAKVGEGISSSNATIVCLVTFTLSVRDCWVILCSDARDSPRKA